MVSTAVGSIQVTSAVPSGSGSTTISSGTVITGGVVSVTLTKNSAMDALPPASLDVHVTPDGRIALYCTAYKANTDLLGAPDGKLKLLELSGARK